MAIDRKELEDGLELIEQLQKSAESEREKIFRDVCDISLAIEGEQMVGTQTEVVNVLNYNYLVVTGLFKGSDEITNVLAIA